MFICFRFDFWNLLWSDLYTRKEVPVFSPSNLLRKQPFAAGGIEVRQLQRKPLRERNLRSSDRSGDPTTSTGRSLLYVWTSLTQSLQRGAEYLVLPSVSLQDLDVGSSSVESCDSRNRSIREPVETTFFPVGREGKNPGGRGRSPIVRVLCE